MQGGPHSSRCHTGHTRDASLTGVPTVWLNLLDYVRQHRLSFHHLKTVTIGGAAAPRSMIKTFQELNVKVGLMAGA